PGLNGSRKIAPKTNTVLQYNSGWNVTNWEIPALAQKPRKSRKKSHDDPNGFRPIELFKLHLADIPEYQKPELPYGLNYHKVIQDYLEQMNTFVDKQFKIFLEQKLGKSVIDLFIKKYYSQYQYLIIDFFCPRVKFGFSGEPSEFRPIDLDIEKICPALINLVSGSIKDELEEENWLIEIGYEDVISIFDPVVNNIIKLIYNQLNMSKQKCSAMFLAGGFSESSYLINKIRTAFGSEIPIISVLQNPITAVLCGA
ncbi:17418_t:CDS:2, partial [Racocetra fulgida]